VVEYAAERVARDRGDNADDDRRPAEPARQPAVCSAATPAPRRKALTPIARGKSSSWKSKCSTWAGC